MDKELQGQFICATKQYCQLYQHINAPYIRRTFFVPVFQKAEVYICGLGFYDAYINGKRITKGRLAPYISNPDHILYYDRYDISDYLREGENAVGVILGNGSLNNMGAFPWGNDDTPYRSSPKLALTIVLDGKVLFCPVIPTLNGHLRPLSLTICAAVSITTPDWNNRALVNRDLMIRTGNIHCRQRGRRGRQFCARQNL